jgi:hypothetical protein
MDQKILLGIVIAVVGIAAAILFLAPGPEQKVNMAPGAAAEPAKSEVGVSVDAVSSATQGETTAAAGVPQGDVVQPSIDLAAASSALPAHRVVATYFHNTTRCATCRNIEQLARETMETTFAAEMATGKLVWRALNMEEKENEHYAIDYGLTSPSLVLAEMDGDREVRFKVLEETWTLIHRKLQFEPYVENETRAFLEGD